MTLSMYQASVPAFVQYLQSLSGIIDKAEAYATARKIEPAVILQTRLFPDMFPLVRQVQIACDFAKGASARLAGVELPSYEDNEKTFADVKARIAKTIAFIQSIKPAQIDGSEGRDISIKIAGNPVSFKGEPYLVQFALPNFYFHLSIAYAILRQCGVQLGKGDYMGRIPGM
jgi:uncharacterized protein